MAARLGTKNECYMQFKFIFNPNNFLIVSIYK